VSKYQKLDDAICLHIERGVGSPANSSDLEELARPLLSNRAPFPAPAWRLIDRRMQAMRKSGRLSYDSIGGGKKRWHVVWGTARELEAE
jgi:hypothetical protein